MADDSIPPKLISRKEARALGLVHFFTGKPCRKGHVARRATIGGCCVICANERSRAWRAANIERAKAIKDKWRANNVELDRATKRAYNARNREKLRVYAAAHYRANKGYYSKLTRKWKHEHPDECAVSAYNCRARKMGWTGPFMTLEIYRSMVAQQMGLCAYCGEARPLVFEHVQALAREGGHEPTNAVLACDGCNIEKWLDPVDVFLKRLAKKRADKWTATPDHIAALLNVPWRRSEAA